MALEIVILLGLALVGGDHPAEPDAIIEVVETLVLRRCRKTP